MSNKIKKVLMILISAVVVSGILIYGFQNDNLEYVEYKSFYENVETGNIETVLIEDDSVKFTIKNDKQKYYTENPNYEEFKEKLLLNGVTVTENSSEENIAFVFDLLFYLIYFGIIIFAVTKFIKMNNETFKVVKHTRVKFEDIAGMEELKKEMMKIVEILKNPKEYETKGIRQTKGIILEGTPGNRKNVICKGFS